MPLNIHADLLKRSWSDLGALTLEEYLKEAEGLLETLSELPLLTIDVDGHHIENISLRDQLAGHNKSSSGVFEASVGSLPASGTPTLPGSCFGIP